MGIIEKRHDYLPDSAADHSLMPLEGIAALSTGARDILVRTGVVLVGTDHTNLPFAYRIRQERDALTETPDRDPADSIGNILPHVERMANTGVSLKQLCHRLAIPIGVMREAMVFLPAVASAVQGGLARGVERVTEALQREALGGNYRAQNRFLETQGEGWEARALPPQVQIHTGKEAATVTLDAIEFMQDEQAALMHETVYLAIS